MLVPSGEAGQGQIEQAARAFFEKRKPRWSGERGDG